MPRPIQRALRFALLLIIPLAIGEGLREAPFVRSMEEIASDIRIRYFAPTPSASPDIVIVALDEPTMQSLPFRSPIPRLFLRDLHERLAAAKPRLVAYDIFFKDQSFRSEDERFAHSLERFPPHAVSLGRDGPGGIIQEDLPLELFRSRLAGVGLADLPMNPFSQVMRKARMEYLTTSGIRPTFVGAIYEALSGKRAFAHVQSQSTRQFGITFPVADERGSILIRYLRPPTEQGKPTIPTYSAQLLADGLIPSEWLSDKVVFVGATFDDAQDLFLTPYYTAHFGYRRVPGVEIHAQILSSLLTGSFFGRFTIWQERLYLLGLLLLLVVTMQEGRSWRLFVLPLLLLCCPAIVSITVARQMAVMAPLVPPTMALTMAFGLCLAWRTLSEGRQRRWLKSTFSKYVAPAVVEDLVRHPERVSLVGERRTITCLFSDIQNFTTMSEQLEPERVVAFLNDYLGTLSEAILKHRGTIDKYEGDSIVAFFGAPLPLDDHATQAVLTAIAMQKGSQSVSERWATTLGQPIVTRVGIHTGEAVVGNIGSDVRFDYTAIGDTVNIASRLEGINKEYGTRIILSEVTKDLVAGAVTVRPLGRVRPKGKTDDMPIYEAVI